MKRFTIPLDVSRWRWAVVSVAVAAGLSGTPPALAGHVADGRDVKITLDNRNRDGGTPTPGHDRQNRQANEPSVALSPVDPRLVAAGGNDNRMAPVFGDVWIGLYVSSDGGGKWFNTMVPGFPSDASPAGLASPLLGLDASGDPVVRFDGRGNLYVGGIAFNRDFDQEDLSNDTVVYVARYDATPGTPGGTSTPTSAGDPPGFTYAFTTVVDRGAVGFAIPSGHPFGFAGRFDDKNWMAVDTDPGSPCFGTIYFTFTKVTTGLQTVMLARSTDGGLSFSEPRPVSTSGREGSVLTQGSNIGVARNGRVYVVYRTFAEPADPVSRIQVVRSDDCGRHVGAPVTAAIFRPMPRLARGLAFRTPTNPWIAVSDVDPDTVFVAFMALAGSPSNADIFVSRSVDGGVSWGAPVRVNDDETSKHQFWPTIGVSGGALHVAWYDFRDSEQPGDPSSANDVLNVYYASSNTSGVPYPAFSHNVKVSDVGHQPNCRMNDAGTAGFLGDYIELAARVDDRRRQHVVHLAWADHRDVPREQCDLDSAPGPAPNNIGNRNQNIYGDTLRVSR